MAQVSVIFETYIEDLHDAKGNKIDRAPNPMELLTIKVPQPVQAGDMGPRSQGRAHQPL